MASSPSLNYPSVTFALLFLSMTLGVISAGVPCNSQKFSKNRVYKKCANLPTLVAQLHWTYSSSDSSLSIAFIASSASPNGWISWGINPTSTGMIGAQSIIAFKDSDSIAVKTFNITSYSSLVQSKLEFVVSDLSAEQSGQTMRIFAKFALPANLTTINHVWQVGSTVNRGLPMKHDFGSENLDAYATLNLLRPAALSPSPSVLPSPSPSPSAPTGGTTRSPPPSNSGEQSSKMRRIQCSIYVLLFIFMASIFYS